jgi:hypothetical protein
LSRRARVGGEGACSSARPVPCSPSDHRGARELARSIAVGKGGQWLAGRASGWRVGSVVGGSGQWLARGGQWLTRGASGWRVGPVVGGSDQWLATGGLFHVPCSPLDFERGWWTEKKTQKDLSRKKNYRVRVSKPAPEHGTWNTGRRAPRPHTRVQGRGAASRCIAGSVCRVQHALS